MKKISEDLKKYYEKKTRISWNKNFEKSLM